MGIVQAKERRHDPLASTKEIPFGTGHPCESRNITETKTVDLTGITARVDRVTVEGVVRTKDEVIRFAVQELFQASNFYDMIRRAHMVRSRLASFGCFRNIGIHIDTSEGPGATPHGYEVIFQVTEHKRVSGGVSSHLTNNECLLAVNVNFPNLFGRGETVKGEFQAGSRRSQIFNISLIKPFMSRKNVFLTPSIFQTDLEFPMSGYKVIDRGLLFDLAFLSKPWLKHNLQYEALWRMVGVGNKYASFEVRESAGHALKSTIRHIVGYDGRDSPIFPSCGTNVRFLSEFAGLGGSLGHLKNEFQWQKNWSFFDKDLVFQTAFHAGLIAIPGEDKQGQLPDNFFLGGPLSLRGFEFRGAGPGSEGSYTGGVRYWAAAAHFYTPLPFKPGTGGFGDLFRIHVFVNGGNIGDMEFGESLSDFINKQKEEMRVAVGMGLALRLGQMARVELNYVVPMQTQDSDAAVQGIQFGIGVNFL